MKTALLSLLLVMGCAPATMTPDAQHPANPSAPTGRLAGPPDALRPGVADVSTPARSSSSTQGHSGHDHEHAEPVPIAPPTETRKDDKGAPPPSTEAPKPPQPAHQGHEGHH